MKKQASMARNGHIHRPNYCEEETQNTGIHTNKVKQQVLHSYIWPQRDQTGLQGLRQSESKTSRLTYRD